MPANTENQAQRRKDAIFSAVFYTFLCVTGGVLTLALRSYYHISGFWGIFLLLAACMDFGIVIPIFISLKIRLKEIQGGEEDAAAQY